MAYVWDDDGTLAGHLNPDFVIMQRLEVDHYVQELKNLIVEHVWQTQSELAERLLRDFDRELPRFWQIVPKELLDKLPVPVTAAPDARALLA
jgi:glutamate synthase (NADPH) large chain